MLLLTTVAAILSVVFATVYVSHLFSEKVASACAIDAIALSAATWEARGMNVIAALNDGILQCMRLIRWTCVIWAVMAVAACTGTGLPAFIEYSKHATRTIRSAWKCAHNLTVWAEKVKSFIPYLVLAETASLCHKLNVTGVLFPFDPRGKHEHERTLELHLTKAPPISLADALLPINKVKKKISRWKWAKKIAGKIIGVLDSALHSIAGADPGPLRMLIPEAHFPDRQRISFSGYKAVTPLPLPFSLFSKRNRFYVEASGEPYGGTETDMTWKSRLIEWRRNR